MSFNASKQIIWQVDALELLRTIEIPSWSAGGLVERVGEMYPRRTLRSKWLRKGMIGSLWWPHRIGLFWLVEPFFLISSLVGFEFNIQVGYYIKLFFLFIYGVGLPLVKARRYLKCLLRLMIIVLESCSVVRPLKYLIVLFYSIIKLGLLSIEDYKCVQYFTILICLSLRATSVINI